MGEIGEWEWRMVPETVRRHSGAPGVNPGSKFYTQHWELICSVDELILKANAVECLTSNAEYIRKCKEYYQKLIIKKQDGTTAP